MRVSRQHATLRAFVILLSATIGLAVYGGTAEAQGKARATQGQAELNEEGIEAALRGDHETAIRLFRASIDLGPLNVTYLNLGRALHRSGQCNEAAAAYAAVPGAPKATNTPAAQVEETLASYLDLLGKDCPSGIQVQCAPGGSKLKVTIDGAAAECGSVTNVPPGPHTLRIEGDGDPREQALDVPQYTVVTYDVAPIVKKGEGENPVQESEPFDWSWAPAATMGTGGAILVGALLYDFIVIGGTKDDLDAAAAGTDEARYNSVRSDLDSQQRLNVVLIGVGLGAVAGGALWYWLDQDDSEVQVFVGPTGAGATVHF